MPARVRGHLGVEAGGCCCPRLFLPSELGSLPCPREPGCSGPLGPGGRLQNRGFGLAFQGLPSPTFSLTLCVFRVGALSSSHLALAPLSILSCTTVRTDPPSLTEGAIGILRRVCCTRVLCTVNVRKQTKETKKSTQTSCSAQHISDGEFIPKDKGSVNTAAGQWHLELDNKSAVCISEQMGRPWSRRSRGGGWEGGSSGAAEETAPEVPAVVGHSLSRAVGGRGLQHHNLHLLAGVALGCGHRALPLP